VTVPARRPEDDALDRLEAALGWQRKFGPMSSTQMDECVTSLATVREALERLRSVKAIAQIKELLERAESAEAEARQLRERLIFNEGVEQQLRERVRRLTEGLRRELEYGKFGKHTESNLRALLSASPTDDPRCTALHPRSTAEDRCERPAGHTGDHVSRSHSGSVVIYPSRWSDSPDGGGA
jgi:hypothetical protein